jgi:AcrR family transcriptional regulator
MASARRIGAEHSQTRAELLDAAERLMLEEGYPAATSRRVATRAGVKPGLVHYYFRTMDDLFIALFRRRAERGLERQARALASPQPLWSLWEMVREEPNTAITMELVALANHRKALRAEIAAHAERLRELQVEALSGLLGRYGLDSRPSAAVIVMVLMSSISRFLVMEQALGVSAGHPETVAMVERYLRRFEGERRRPTTGPASSTRRSPSRRRRSGRAR